MDRQKTGTLKKLGLLLLFSLFPGCATMHPFSDGPGSSGKLDLTPRVLILRGQDYVVCRTGDSTPLAYFIHLNHMPPQEVVVWVGEEDSKDATRYPLFGTQLTVKVAAKMKPGFTSWHQINFLTAGQVYSMITVVTDCGGSSAWSSTGSGEEAEVQAY